MAILHADNFSIYGDNSLIMLEGVYAEVDGFLRVDPDGISPGRVFDTRGANTNVNFSLRYVCQNGPVSTLGVAFRSWLTSLPGNSSGAKRYRVLDEGNNEIASLYFSTTGAIVVRLIGGATYTTPIPVVTSKGWYHIEFKYTFLGAGKCSFEVRVEGATVLTQTDVTVTSATPAQLGWLSSNTQDDSYRYYIKDLVVWDTSGSLNTDFLGSVIVTTLTPQEDVSLNWTPVGGATGSGILDNIPPVNSQYIAAEDVPIPAPYVCSLTDLPDEVTSVRALVSFVRAAKSDGGDGSLQTSIISDADGTPATIDGANRPITVAQTYWRDIFEIDPKTGNQWIPADVNDINLKINRTT